MKIVNWNKTILMILGLLVSINPLFAGQVTYPNDSYSTGQTLTATDLNGKFNQIKSAVNDNDSKATKMDYAESTSTTPIQLTTTLKNIQSVSVTVPGAGYVIVSFSANYTMIHTTGTADQMQFGISESSSPTLNTLPSFRFLYMDSVLPSFEFDGVVATQGVFQITSTSTSTHAYSVYGISNKTTGTDAFSISNPATQAIFIAN